MPNTSIQSFIQIFRSQQVKSRLHRGMAQLAIVTIISLLLLGLLESVFYFTIPVRVKTAEFFILLLFTGVLFISLRYFLHSKSLFNNSTNEFLAQDFEKRKPQIGDRLLNALQLEDSMEDLVSSLLKNLLDLSKKAQIIHQEIPSQMKFGKIT